MLDRGPIRDLTFDCYGTLIDWETGLLSALRPVFAARGRSGNESEWLESYAIVERYAEGADGRGYRPYWQVLREAMAGLDQAFGLRLSEDELGALTHSLPRWPAFPDTIAAMERLRAAGYRIGVISNIDEALFRATCEHSALRPDWVITAEQCQSYKPSPNNFKTAERAQGLNAASWVHVAQSLYHDIEPASRLGLRTIWVDRRAGKAGPGATYPAHATPTARVESLAEVVTLLGA